MSKHIDHILSKLGVRSRAQAVALAYRRDVIGPIGMEQLRNRAGATNVELAKDADALN